jgi:hypothetical protein
MAIHIRRRELLAALGGAAAWPLVARAEDRIRRIGVLMNFTANDTTQAARLAKFREALEALGWIEGRSIHVETRWSHGDADQVRKDVAELIALSPDVIVVTTTPALTILERATKTVPIVFASIVDPVGSRLVATMSRPGGNATGFVAFEYALAAKWLELLKELAPRVTRAAVLRDSSATGIGSFAAVQAVGSIGMDRRRAPRRSRRHDYKTFEKGRKSPYCGPWNSTSQKARSPHGAQSCNRRSDPNQSKQESRIPGGQGFEDGRLTVERSVFNVCPVNEYWRGMLFDPA